jgi:SNF2 family DNA or RNA helicase
VELLPHQTEAVEKFAKVRAVLIGDKMGVGKTVTGIGRDLRIRSDYGKPGAHIRTLIICQKSGLSVWTRHLLQFGVASSRILTINPADRRPFEAELKKGANRYDYYVVHWNVLTKLEDINSTPKIEWHHVIADESHYLKNRKSARTREVKKLNAVVKTALSGTPADDKPEDLWSTLNWLYPRLYSSYWRFYEDHVDYDLSYTGYRIPKGPKNIPALHAQMKHFYISRSLQDVRGDMPKKSYTTVEVDLTPRQRREYDRMQKFHIMGIGDDEELVASLPVSVIMRQQQMTAGTCTVDWTTEEWDKYYDALMRYDEERTKWELSGKNGKAPKRPAGPHIQIDDPSPKLDALFEIIEDNEHEKFVVFTNYTSVAELVIKRCNQKKIEAVSYTGLVTDTGLRDRAVDDFQHGSARVFVGTTKAAGTTITLNAAHTLCFLDRHWNPSVNAQAEDRIYRIDNDDLPVQIIDFVARDTIDLGKLQKIDTKAQWLIDFLTLKE